MKELHISKLESIETSVRNLEVFQKSWKNDKSFSLYLNQQRPCSALFFICDDIQATYSPINDEPIIGGKGDVIYIPKGAQYHVNVESHTGAGSNTYTINFNLFDRQNEEILLSSLITRIATRQDSLLSIHFSKLFEAAHGIQKNHLKINAEFYELLDIIAFSANAHSAAYYPIRIGVEALRSQWNQNVKIEEYASMCGVSNTYFYRCFHDFTGKSPIQYRNTLRLSNAETMLRLTDMSVTDISSTIGFTDSFYFCRLFTKQYGLSPQKYRKKEG